MKGITLSKALADETRWRIVHLLLVETMCACELAAVLEMPQSSISSHLQIIRKAGILTEEKCEKWTYLRIATPHVALLQSWMSHMELSAEESSLLSKDQTRATSRIHHRNQICCPKPRSL